ASARARRTPPASPRAMAGLRALLLLGCALTAARAFNLDAERPAVYSGAEGSYFGFAVDFFAPDPSSIFLLVGAPKANTSQHNVVEGGQVLRCNWNSNRNCQPIIFDSTGNRDFAPDDPLEFKSHQWFGASVRSKNDKILACAPLYHWRTETKQEREPVGTCYLLAGSKSVEYAPCRSSNFFFFFAQTFLCVYVITTQKFVLNFVFQMAAYFGYSVAATDINGDDYTDLFIGAPLFMDRGSDGKLQEVGQVSICLQRASGGFQIAKLNGFEIFARFGSAIAPLGDLDQDGFNDIAVAAPYGGEDKRGLVYIYNGRATGLNAVPSQILEGQWAARTMPPSFGYSLKGATDVDKNGYPDLIVGAFGVDTAVLYRYVLFYAFTKVNKKESSLAFVMELLLDKLKQKGAIRRALFLHSKQPSHSKNMTITKGGKMNCEELDAFLRDESEFRDKLTPITIFMEYRLDYKTAADATGLHPILNQFTPANMSRQAHILLDCGEDNICKPKLEVSVRSDQKKIYIGDDNPLTLTVTAENQGEGAYEAELFVIVPPQADFIGVVRNNEALARLSCAFKTENQTRMVVCDLGNPMKAGTKLLAGLRFSVHQQSEMDTSVKFDLQIRSVSSPDHIFLPIANWQPKENPETEDDIGPLVQHIYELRNNGPSAFSKVMMTLQWPYKYKNYTLLYIVQYDIDGPMNCTSDMEINPLKIKISASKEDEKNETFSREDNRNHRISRRDLTAIEGDVQTLGCGNADCLKIVCQVGHLERGKSAILYLKSRLWTQTFMNNHSYSLKSSASFNVIEFPYKNLSFEDIHNSTVVSNLHLSRVNKNNYFVNDTKNDCSIAVCGLV
uniref:Integrin subunit alpha V n=1 Tax=Phasianus colchicus TaxID=9054 RepID=A0A669QI00_PHACC